MKNHLRAVLGSITGDETSNPNKTYSALKGLNKAKDWHPSIKGNAYVSSEEGFNRLAFLIEMQYTARPVKELSVTEFYTINELLADKNKGNGK